MINIKKLFTKNKNEIITDHTRKLHYDDLFTNWPLVKQNILGGLSCIFILLFSNVFRMILEVKYFNFLIQIQFLILLVLSLTFLAFTLFFSKKKVLIAWCIGFIFCSVILFVEILPFKNPYFYLSLIVAFLLFLLASRQYKKINETFLKFNWKLVFQAGFIYQFFGVMAILIGIIAFSYVNINNNVIDGFKPKNIVHSITSFWVKNNPDSVLNKTLDSAVNDFVSKNSLLSNFQKQYSVIGLSMGKVVTDNIKNMFNSNFDTKVKVADILTNYFSNASQTTKTIVSGIFLWFVLSVVGLLLFVSKTLVYYFSQIIMSILIWIGFFAIEERPAIKEDLILK